MELNSSNIKKILFIIVVSILVFLGVQNFGIVMRFSHVVIKILKPFIIGVCIAFTLNGLLRLLEDRVFSPLNRSNSILWKKSRRGICILLTYAILGGILFVLFFLIVPELRKSFQMLLSNINIYAAVFQNWTDKMISTLNISPDYANTIRIDWDKVFSMLGSFMKNVSNDFINTTMNITSAVISVVVNTVIGIAFSVYMLFQKEKLASQAKRICLAYFSRKRAEYLISVGKLSNKIFARFIVGQFTEAIIIGLLCFIGMNIFSMPYSSLISTIVGVTSLIPVFGALIGTGVGVFVLLMVEPMTAVWFIVFIIVLQQIEGNIIYPRVVGNSIGLPGIWVLLAVTVGGSSFGVMGMLLGIPLSSIIYCLFKNEVSARLRRRGISYADIEGLGVDFTETM
ncbi:AI-2E family transporter [Clostridium cylindrosporum]|uniref:Permease n=1 Tax=Clostridium cylindrosporum DSM 605 TaxID=1121307 RepID=A0A0J8D9L7_CLOCY|nr:AI-2E family transporter [Clostridium cylindrosporum]KMT22527.1 hypothetical protein CLCY_10c00720 [Clostridium cylindrosporum DSM 605]